MFENETLTNTDKRAILDLMWYRETNREDLKRYLNNEPSMPWRISDKLHCGKE